jgi:lambda repressor-like predicted transcriptional regulator
MGSITSIAVAVHLDIGEVVQNRRPRQAGALILSAVTHRRTNQAFVEEVPRLLQERGMSIRALAREACVTNAHLSRVLRRANYKTPSADLARRVSTALGLPPDYFPEFREGTVIDAIRSNPALRDRLFNRLSR